MWSVLALTLCSIVLATFDFNGCEPGSGSFVQVLPRDRIKVFALGVLPRYKKSIRVQLTAKNDLDITLLDPSDTSRFPEGKAIVGWCADQAVCNLGLLYGREPGWVMYRGMNISYSGYDGQVVNGVQQKGNEYIVVEGTLPVDLKIGVLAYFGGDSTVKYSWQGDASDCCAGSARCYGSFDSYITRNSLKNIGQIPKGVRELEIHLQCANPSSEDVDVQLFDVAANTKYTQGKAIIGYCFPYPCNSGILSGATEQAALYMGVLYRYSGYNGYINTLPRPRGSEYIKLTGTTNRVLMMSVYGYTSGTASVNYSYLYTPPDPCAKYTGKGPCEIDTSCRWRVRCQSITILMQTECAKMPSIGLRQECNNCMTNPSLIPMQKLMCVYSIPLAPLFFCMDKGATDAALTKPCMQSTMCGSSLDACRNYFSVYWEQCPPILDSLVQTCITSAMLEGFNAARNNLPCSSFPEDKKYLCDKCDQVLESDVTNCLMCASETCQGACADACADGFYGRAVCRRLTNSTFINPCLQCAVPGSPECLIKIFQVPQVLRNCYYSYNTTDEISDCVANSAFCSPALFPYGPVQCNGIAGQIFLECGLPPTETCVRELITFERQYYLMDPVPQLTPGEACNLASLSSNSVCSGCDGQEECYAINIVTDMCFGITDPDCMACIGPSVLSSTYCAAKERATAIVSCFHQHTLTCLESLCRPTDDACYDRLAAFSWRCPPSWDGLYFATVPGQEMIDCIAKIIAGGYSE